MHSETNPRGRLARTRFRSVLDEMRDKGIVQERTLTGYVCDDCDIEDPIAYRVIADYGGSASDRSCAGLVVSAIAVILGIVLMPVFLIGLLILLIGLGFGVYEIIQGRRGKEDETVVIVRQGELACAVCYGSPVSVDTTRGLAILKRIRSNQPPSTEQGSSHG